MPTSDLRASTMDATVREMFDPIPLLLARDAVRARTEGPVPEPRPARARLLLASGLRRLADRVEGRIAHPRPAARSLAQRGRA
jgi:hypothetical protein